MKRIKFLVFTIFETHGADNPENPRFDVDQVEDMRDDQAQRWLKRKRAELIEDLGPDVDPAIAGADPEKVQELRDAIARERAAEDEALADDLDDAADNLKAALG